MRYLCNGKTEIVRIDRDAFDDRPGEIVIVLNHYRAADERARSYHLRGRA